LITRLILPVFFCLLAAGPLVAGEAPPDASAGPRTLDFADPRLKATGRDWMALEAPDKFALMRTLFSFYGLSEETHDVERAVGLMDLMYLTRRNELTDGVEKKEALSRLDRDALMNFPVHLNFMYIVNDTASAYGVRYFEKKEAAQEAAPEPAGQEVAAGRAPFTGRVE